MKKVFLALALVVAGITASQAQVSFRPGIKGGLNISRFTQNESANQKYSWKNDFYVGVVGELNLSKVYTLQPEIVYSRQGAVSEVLNNFNVTKEDINVSYLSFGIANKFKAKNFSFIVGPSVDININDKGKELGQNYNNDFTGVDLAFFGGVGYNFTKEFSLEARIKKGIIPVVDDFDYNATNIVFQVGAVYTFGK